MSIVSYNGVSLPDPHIVDFQQSAIGDDMSNTDWVYLNFDIKVECVLNFNYLSLIDPTLLRGDVPATQNPADIMNVIRLKLLSRRKTLSITCNGVNLIPEEQTGLPGTVDAKNGPIPQSCVLTQVTNTTFICRWHVTANYWQNKTLKKDDTVPELPVQNATGNNILWNRWTESIEIDQEQYTKRTRNGKFIIRSDNANGAIVDQLRLQAAVVGLPTGFVRVSSSYTVSPDGLGISYIIVDKEVFRMPPQPAFSADGEYTESTSRLGAKRYGECRVRLRGSKNTSQQSLANLAVQIACAKLYSRELALQNQVLFGGFGNIVNVAAPGIGGQIGQGVAAAIQFGAAIRAGQPVGAALAAVKAKAVNEGGNDNTVVEYANLQTRLWENEVSFTIKVWFANNPARFQGLAAFYNLNCYTPFSTGTDPKFPAIDGGTANLALAAAAYWDPSLAGINIDPVTGQFNQGAAGFIPGQAGKKKETN